MAAGLPQESIAKIRGNALKRLRQQGACLLGELRYLWSLVRNQEVKKWAKSYVSLNAIYAQSKRESGAPQPLLNLIERYADSASQVVVLGEPGSGKTATLYAATYRLALRALRGQVACWIIFLSIGFGVTVKFRLWKIFTNWKAEAVELSKFSAVVLLLLSCMLVALIFLEWISRQWPLPILIELRRYQGESLEEFLKNVLKGAIGGLAISDQFQGYVERRRLVWLMDGVNEIKAGSYGKAIEGWRGYLQPGQYFKRSPAIFTSRAGQEDPTAALGLEDVLTVQELNDPGVREYLRAYGSRHIERDFDLLKSNGLLGEGGLGRNPYWLKMLAVNDFSSQNRGRLFERFAEELITRELSREPHKGPGESPAGKVPVRVELSLLAGLALEMNVAREIGCSLERATRIVEEILAKNKHDYKSGDVLLEAQAATLIQISDSEGRVDFVHQLVQEFFAAYALRLDTPRAIDHAVDPWWWRTLLMVGGLVKNHIVYGEALLGAGEAPSRILLTAGLLRSVDNPDGRLERHVMERLVESLRFGLTEELKQPTVSVSQIVGDRLVDLLATLFERDEAYAKIGTIGLLQTIGGKRSCELLIRSFKDRTLVTTSMEALIANGVLAVEPLISSLEHCPDDVCNEVVIAMERIGKVAVEPLLSALDNSNPRVRSFVVLALGGISAPNAVQPLMTTLRDNDDNVRLSAAKALGKIGSPAVEPLIAAVSGTDDLMLSSAITALSYIGAPAVGPLLSRWWKTYTQSLVLVGFGDSATGERLENTVRNQRYRSAATAVLRNIGTPAFEELIDNIADKSWSLRRYGCDMLENIAPILPGLLIADLRDGDSNTRESASQTLKKILYADPPAQAR